MAPPKSPPIVDDRAHRAGYRLGQLLQGLVIGPLLFGSLAALFALASNAAPFSYQGY